MGMTEFDASKYRLPQNEKLKGVMMTQTNVENADRLTESDTLPLAKEVMKLEIFPPGQAATKIIPIATDCERMGRSAMHNKNVTAGNRTICEKTPTIKLFGFLTTSLKSETFIRKAIPNITNARITFMTDNDVELKFNLISSNTCNGDI